MSCINIPHLLYLQTLQTQSQKCPLSARDLLSMPQLGIHQQSPCHANACIHIQCLYSSEVSFHLDINATTTEMPLYAQPEPTQPHCWHMLPPTLTWYTHIKAFFHPPPCHNILCNFRKNKGEPYFVEGRWSRGMFCSWGASVPYFDGLHLSPGWEASRLNPGFSSNLALAATWFHLLSHSI